MPFSAASAWSASIISLIYVPSSRRSCAWWGAEKRGPPPHRAPPALAPGGVRHSGAPLEHRARPLDVVVAEASLERSPVAGDPGPHGDAGGVGPDELTLHPPLVAHARHDANLDRLTHPPLEVLAAAQLAPRPHRPPRCES